MLSESNDCTCAKAILESENRQRKLPDGTRLFPFVKTRRGLPAGLGTFFNASPIFEVKSD